jgi:cell division protease FtsH
MQLPEEDRYSYDRTYLMSRIAVLFGGRIAEELFMDQMTTGASNDFERATSMARDMVTRYGMSDLGVMVYGENEGEVFLGRSVTQHKNVSEATMQKVDAEIRRIVREQEAMHLLIQALMAEIQALKEATKEQKRGPGRPPKDTNGN